MRHATQDALVCKVQYNIQAARWSQAIMLRTAASDGPSDTELPMKISMMDNEITNVDYDTANEISIEM